MSPAGATNKFAIFSVVRSELPPYELAFAVPNPRSAIAVPLTSEKYMFPPSACCTVILFDAASYDALMCVKPAADIAVTKSSASSPVIDTVFWTRKLDDVPAVPLEMLVSAILIVSPFEKPAALFVVILLDVILVGVPEPTERLNAT